MGMEFYNLQIKKNGNDIRSKIKDFIESKGYSLTDKENAIGSIAVLNNPNCNWIAISSDFFIQKIVILYMEKKYLNYSNQKY